MREESEGDDEDAYPLLAFTTTKINEGIDPLNNHTLQVLANPIATYKTAQKWLLVYAPFPGATDRISGESGTSKVSASARLWCAQRVCVVSACNKYVS